MHFMVLLHHNYRKMLCSTTPLCESYGCSNFVDFEKNPKYVINFEA